MERFEAMRRGVVRLGSRLCDLSYANAYAGAQEESRAVLRDALADERTLDLQYSPFGGQTVARRVVADHLRHRHGPPYSFAHVVLTPGAMGALHIALRSAGAPGAEVVVPVPCWLDHPLYVRFAGLSPVTVELDSGDWKLDVEAIAGAITDRTCAVLLSHPANPTGRAYTREELEHLAGALARAEHQHGRGITLISDETHCDFADADEFVSACRVHPQTVLVYSFGKYHLMQGQRLGFAACSPRHPRAAEVSEEMVRWTRVTGLATPTALMQRAIPRLLELEHDLSWVGAWRSRFCAALRGAGFEVVEPNATMFVYPRTPPGEDDFEFAGRLARSGVLVMPAPVFHHRGHFRLALTASEPMLERALEVFAGQVAA